MALRSATKAAVEPPRADLRVHDAQVALQAFWASPGTRLGAAEAARACRALTPGELRLVDAWIPRGNPGSSTAVKCDMAREIVAAVLVEKGDA